MEVKILFRSEENRTEIKIICGLVFLISLYLILVFTIHANADGSGEDYPYSGNGNWIVDSETTVWNETIVLNGNLSVEDGGNLTFMNITLYLNCSYPGEFHIKVKNGGQFYIFDNDNNKFTSFDASNITSMNPDNNYNFSVENGSKLKMKNSEIHECGVSGDGGLLIESDDVIIDGNLISNNLNGIVCNSSAIISNNIIKDNEGIGISCNFAEPEIFNNLILNNSKIGIDCYMSNPKIVENIILNHTHGIYSLMSSPDIINCTIQNSTDYDIHLVEDSNPILINSSFDKDKLMLNKASQPSSIEVRYFLNLLITNQFENEIPDADIRIQDNENGTYDENFISDKEGKKNWILLTEYIETNDGKKIFTPFKINASFDENYKEMKVNLNESKSLEIIIEEKILEMEIINPKDSETLKNTVLITVELKNDKNLEFISFSINGTELQNSTSPTFEWNTSDYENSEYKILVNAKDEKYFAEDTIKVIVENKKEITENHAPVITTENILETKVLEEYSVQYEFTDIDVYDTHTWNLETNATWLKMDVLGKLSGTPSQSDVGSFWVNISVTDNGTPTMSDFTNFTLVVKNKEIVENNELKIKITEISFPKSAKEGENVTITVKIKNIGNISISDLNITIYYYNNKIESSIIENNIAPGKELSIEFVWKAVFGNHTITVDVKDNSGIFLATKKSEEKINVTKTVIIDDGDDNEDKFPILVFFLPLIFLIILVFTAIKFKKSKTKKKSEKDDFGMIKQI